MSEHWYTRGGKPSHTRISKSGVIRSTTLRDARLEHLLPSVSSVLNEAAAPELDRWKANKILEACYSSGDPLAVAPTLSEYSAIIRERADKEMEQVLRPRQFGEFAGQKAVTDNLKVFVQAAKQRPSAMPNALTFDAVYNYGIKDPHFVLGPKIPEANEYHSIIASETQRMLSGEMTPADTAASVSDAPYILATFHCRSAWNGIRRIALEMAPVVPQTE
jgi:hypothetical protein